MSYDPNNSEVKLSSPTKFYKMEGSTILYAFNNIYFAIFTLFCFKLLIKISLALLTHFYIVKGNRKEAARIAEEIYGIAPGKTTTTNKQTMIKDTKYSDTYCDFFSVKWSECNYFLAIVLNENADDGLAANSVCWSVCIF